jgi:hypothetical protein
MSAPQGLTRFAFALNPNRLSQSLKLLVGTPHAGRDRAPTRVLVSLDVSAEILGTRSAPRQQTVGVQTRYLRALVTPKAPECKTLRGFRLPSREPLVARRDDDRRHAPLEVAGDLDRMGPGRQRV